MPCPFHELTGLLCPLCGGTRAVLRLLDGDIVGSLGFHPLAVPLALVVVYVAVARRVAAVPLPASLPRAVAVVLAGFTVLRNLPGLDALGPPA
ncbi:MAG TPA: DUF2752 domain-containing protein [Acidimicrobiales bacterium]|nr:DUF2752 domain-containing protein [Acidimicrobiales bacterium]